MITVVCVPKHVNRYHVKRTSLLDCLLGAVEPLPREVVHSSQYTAGANPQVMALRTIQSEVASGGVESTKYGGLPL
jgi:hypothetical protein